MIAEFPKLKHYDVVIVGGAMFGTSVAWFLSHNPDFNGSILVVERDPSYEFASTSHTHSCMRQQFSSEINIRVSQFAADFVLNFRQHMGKDSRVPELSILNFGYLYLANTAAFAEKLRAAQKIQLECGAGTRYMTPEEIKSDYPFYYVDDLIGGNHNRLNEGYFDSGTLFDWWKRTARENGVEYIHNEVVDMVCSTAGSRIESVMLNSGEAIHCGTVVNASGPRAAQTAQMAGN